MSRYLKSAVAFQLMWFLALPPVQSASYVVTPSSIGAAEGNSANAAPLNSATPKTDQFVISPAELIGLNIGDTITGLTYRLNGDALTAPAAPVSYNDCEIRLFWADRGVIR